MSSALGSHDNPFLRLRVARYTYDSKDQLTQESSTRAGGYTNNFSYDSAGNATSFKGTSHSYNSNNQDTGNTYDGNGNPTTYQATTCTFDPENRMTAFGSALTATYRGDGLRAKTVTGAGTTYFIYDGELLLAEMNSSGSLTAVSTWGAAGMASRSTSGGTTFYTFDPQGSVVQRLNGSGTVVTSDAFDGYGTGVSTGTADAYGYCARSGYRSDAATGLLYCTHRYYDAAAGRWMTRDPIGSAGGINVYGYCGNQATRYRDHRGLQVDGGGEGGGEEGGEGRPPENPLLREPSDEEQYMAAGKQILEGLGNLFRRIGDGVGSMFRRPPTPIGPPQTTESYFGAPGRGPFIYRGGSLTDNNLTPRPTDNGCLSFRGSLTNALGQPPVLRPGDKWSEFDAGMLPQGRIVFDLEPDGHVL